MAETVNTSEVAVKVADDIFKHFFWEGHPKHDQNFKCLNESHTSDGVNPQSKSTHPCDAAFTYLDPYKGRRMYLNTDFKSYGANSIGTTKVRSAIKSLAMAVECARFSQEWRQIYSVDENEDIDIHGLLFVYNHDQKFNDDFAEIIRKTKLSTIDIAPNIYIHCLGPSDINRLYSIANDLIRLQYEKTLPEKYSFFYPDMVLWHRHGDIWGQPATIEALSAPFLIVKYPDRVKSPSGYVIYYNRQGATVEEFEYFLDCLVRFQMLTSEDLIRIRIAHPNPHDNFNSNFLAARTRYVKVWGLGEARKNILENIVIGKITAVTSTYSAGELGWKEK